MCPIFPHLPEWDREQETEREDGEITSFGNQEIPIESFKKYHDFGELVGLSMWQDVDKGIWKAGNSTNMGTEAG